tara:strand:+ start:9657 stop:9803 length:147 start_codon:yes stop_codon:yes gene_type:complete
MHKITREQLMVKLELAINGLDEIITTHADSGTLKQIARLHIDKIIHNK